MENTTDNKELISLEEKFFDIYNWVKQRHEYCDYPVLNQWLKDINISDPRNHIEKLKAVVEATKICSYKLGYWQEFRRSVEQEIKKRSSLEN